MFYITSARIVPGAAPDNCSESVPTRNRRDSSTLRLLRKEPGIPMTVTCPTAFYSPGCHKNGNEFGSNLSNTYHCLHMRSANKSATTKSETTAKTAKTAIPITRLFTSSLPPARIPARSPARSARLPIPPASSHLRIQATLPLRATIPARSPARSAKNGKNYGNTICRTSASRQGTEVGDLVIAACLARVKNEKNRILDDKDRNPGKNGKKIGHTTGHNSGHVHTLRNGLRSLYRRRTFVDAHAVRVVHIQKYASAHTVVRHHTIHVLQSTKMVPHGERPRRGGSAAIWAFSYLSPLQPMSIQHNKSS